MQLKPAITLRGVRRTDALENEILVRLSRLERYCPRITGGRVMVQLVDRHHESGNRHHVRIELTVPGEQIVVSHETGLHATAKAMETEALTKAAEPDPERKHVRVAIRDAFDVVRRRLQDYVRRQRGASGN